MKIFKFGGASVKDAHGVRNVTHILDKYAQDELIVVISAMGKMTNAFEILSNNFFGHNNTKEQLEFIKTYHYGIVEDLFTDKTHPIFSDINQLFEELEHRLKEKPDTNYNFVYDSIVPFGELLSSCILSHYLNHINYNNLLIDARKLIKTDASYREARINWDKTKKTITDFYNNYIKNQYKISVTQGFIGSTSHGYTTTLGREGSDFTAAILAFALKAENVTIWKDVPGVLNADPKYFKDTVKIDSLSYFDAIELAYYGATVIHPKTVKPLENEGIPLYVKSFLEPHASGTYIGNNKQNTYCLPCIIVKFNQILISIMPKDFSFIVEHNLSAIFSIISKYNVKVNLMQNSALSFSICTDYDKHKTPFLLEDLKKRFKTYYNKDVELYTIRHYNDDTIKQICTNKEIILEQKSRNTVQFVLKKQL